MVRIDLGLSERYLAHWTIQDALRELYQNAIDNGEDNWTSSIGEVSEEATINLSITTLDVTISRDTLLLGETSKNGKDTLGKFGEGYKLAVLVLLRNGMKVTCHTGDEVWYFKLRTNDQFDVKMLSVDIEELDSHCSEVDYSTTFSIEGLPIEEYEEYRSMNLWLQDGYTHIVTKKCEVLLDEHNRSKIFVGGLYVCRYYGSSLYGYNFNIGVFPLGRDRNIIDGWDATWEASRAIVQAVAEDRELLNTILDNIDARDNEQLQQFVTTDDLLSTAMWNKFISEYPDRIPCTGYMLESRLKDYIGGKFVVVTDKEYNLLSKTTAYIEAMNALEERDPDMEPIDFVKMFFDKYQYDDIAGHFGELMLEAEKWEVKD